MASNAFYPPAGVSFSSVYEDGPAAASGLETDVIYHTFNGEEILSVPDFFTAFQRVEPEEVIMLGTSENNYTVKTGSNPKDASSAYLGVQLYDRFHKDDTLLYKAYTWFFGWPDHGFSSPNKGLIFWIALLSLAIGLANMLPVGPLDGGKMMQQALHKLRGEDKGNRTLVKISLRCSCSLSCSL